ncbi:ribonuclease T2 family protein [Sphingomonas asaccharolytica]|uniref:ribonuclease T2 family protein n=1 Tax=Sphingomonas asaccharolytica TaxID=40681 RepID=UPI000835F3EC|nr:ribonuclease T [Sphingomonas asaccharolytica]
MKARATLAALTALVLPGIANAQALVCTPNANPPRPNPELPTADQPQRVLPIGGYTLAITWGPQFCRNGGFTPSARFQCGSGNRFGFTLHGLWPDGVGKDWPQYCTTTDLVPPLVIKGMLCSTPSAQLIQHEWAKHGTCMGTTPAAYFARSSAMYAKLRYPDMDALSRRPLTVGQFAAAFARSNPGIPVGAIRVTAKSGWLDELWLCLDRRFAYERCKPNTGGLPGNARLKIWRGRR